MCLESRLQIVSCLGVFGEQTADCQLSGCVWRADCRVSVSCLGVFGEQTAKCHLSECVWRADCRVSVVWVCLESRLQSECHFVSPGFLKEVTASPYQGHPGNNHSPQVDQVLLNQIEDMNVRTCDCGHEILSTVVGISTEEVIVLICLNHLKSIERQGWWGGGGGCKLCCSWIGYGGGGNSSVGSVLGWLSCMMHSRGFHPPLSLQ